MPWPAVTMSDSRMEFVRRALSKQVSFVRLCREYGISRKTGYKWVTRATEEGLRGVREQSRRPRSSPAQLDETTVCELGKLKLAHPRWGPKKIRALYGRLHGQAPSLSSCHRILRKLGLVEPRKRRVRRSGAPLLNSMTARAPNDLWTVDFKGWWRARNGERCEPLTVRDAYSQYVLATVVMTHTGFEAVKAVFMQLFALYGLPQAIRSDNGSPFAATAAPLGLSRLAAWWISLGIDVVRGRPGCPQDNGAHERMHGDIAAEIAAHVQSDAAAQQAALDLWRREYNEVRPHERLADRCPADIYRRSNRRYVEQRPEYGTGYLVRKVSQIGYIRWNRVPVFISTALATHEVGLTRTADGRYEIWLYHVRLGTFDPQTCLFQVAPSGDLEQARLSA
jgi:putative transposase